MCVARIFFPLKGMALNYTHPHFHTPQIKQKSCILSFSLPLLNPLKLSTLEGGEKNKIL